MPELPDVEVYRRYLGATSLHKRIDTVQVRSNKILGNISSSRLRAALVGREFQSTARHGKQLFAQLNSSMWLALHFGMTGYLKYFKNIDKEPVDDRLLIGFVNGFHLGYCSQRLLGKVELVDNLRSLIAAKHLGPDALDPKFDFPAFKQAMARHKGIVKTALVDQHSIAGIGNIYADEVLFQARVHPQARVHELDETALKRLLQKTKAVLRTAIACGADPTRLPRNYLIPQRYKGGRCPRCGVDLGRIKIGARGAYFCPHCQGAL